MKVFRVLRPLCVAVIWGLVFAIPIYGLVTLQRMEWWHQLQIDRQLQVLGANQQAQIETMGKQVQQMQREVHTFLTQQDPVIQSLALEQRTVTELAQQMVDAQTPDAKAWANLRRRLEAVEAQTQR